MYFSVTNTALQMERGDTYSLPIFINITDEFKPIPYKLENEDRIYIGIYEPGQSFEDALIRKVIKPKDITEENTYIFKLESKDTQFVMPGKYYICMKLKHQNDISTILSERLFWIHGTNPPIDK